MNDSTKELITTGVICIIVLLMAVVTGIIVMHGVDSERWLAIGFCIDKEGMYDITEYGYEVKHFAKEMNCSNKENPLGFSEAMATLR